MRNVSRFNELIRRNEFRVEAYECVCVCVRIYRDAFKMTIILPPTPQNGLHIQSDWKKARERER